MSHRLLVVPTGHGVGVTSVCLGIVRALDQLGVRYGFVRPISDADDGEDRSNALVRLTGTVNPPKSIGRREAEDLLGEGDEAVHVVIAPALARGAAVGRRRELDAQVSGAVVRRGAEDASVAGAVHR